MANTTDELNAEPDKCDAYHEAGHAVVGVVLGLVMKSATIKDTANVPPRTEWDFPSFIGTAAADEKVLSDLTENYAVMCLASRYSEGMPCDVTSLEQREALHGDYLDAQCMRKRCGLTYLSELTVRKLEIRARELTSKNIGAIHLVANRLLAGEVLTGDQVRELTDQSKRIESPGA